MKNFFKLLSLDIRKYFKYSALLSLVFIVIMFLHSRHEYLTFSNPSHPDTLARYFMGSSNGFIIFSLFLTGVLSLIVFGSDYIKGHHIVSLLTLPISKIWIILSKIVFISMSFIINVALVCVYLKIAKDFLLSNFDITSATIDGVFFRAVAFEPLSLLLIFLICLSIIGVSGSLVIGFSNRNMLTLSLTLIAGLFLYGTCSIALESILGDSNTEIKLVIFALLLNVAISLPLLNRSFKEV